MGAAYDLLLERLQSHGHRIQPNGRDRFRTSCPAHGGTDSNLSVAVGDQGVLTKCHSHDCPAEDIAKAVGLTLTDLFDSGGKATYDYGGGHRVIRQRTRDGKKIYQQNKPAVTQLYRHPDSAPIESSEVVVLVEGEKCVDAALHLGEACVTTWPGGAAGVDHVNLDPLIGKSIRIIADNDGPGLKAAAKLVARLSGIATVQGAWVVPEPKASVDDLWVRGGELAELVAAQLAFEETLEQPSEAPSRVLSLRPLSDVSSKRTRFLWDKMIPQSAVCLAAGRGGTGKSSFLIWLAAQVNNGALSGELHGKPAPVLYVSHEDSLDEVVTPRADANGVNREMFYSLGIDSKEVGGVVVPKLPEDLPFIRAAIAQTGAKLLVIDPITSTLGAGGDNHKMADVRMVMDPLNAMAAELGVSVIGIAHFRKGGGSSSDLISGSHAWRDAARAVLLFARDEESDSTVMTLEKINSGEAGKSFRYRLDIVQQMTDEGALTDVARVVWEGDSSVSVGDLINNESERQKQGGLANELLEYIRQFDGRAVPSTDIMEHFAVGDVRRNTVAANLKRLTMRGLIEKPAYGQFQAVMPEDDAPRARGGVIPVTPVTSLREGSNMSPIIPTQHSNIDQEVRTNMTTMTPVTPLRAGARAREIPPESEVGTCAGCGGRLPRSSIEAGEVRHDVC